MYEQQLVGLGFKLSDFKTVQLLGKLELPMVLVVEDDSEESPLVPHGMGPYKTCTPWSK